MDIGTKIKELRGQRGITQERLAEYMNVSSKAVSKWENEQSLPDITLLPRLAMFFGVSADELLSLRPEVTDRRIREYKKRVEDMTRVYDYNGIEKLMEKAVEEYPSNYGFMIELVNALSRTRSKDSLDKRINLCKRIVEDCNDETIKRQAIKYLCTAYKESGQTDAALKLINTLSDEPLDKNGLLEMVLSGEEKIKQAQKNLLYGLDITVHHLIILSSNGYKGQELSLDEKIRFGEAALAVLTAVFYKGHKSANDGNFRHVYERLAELYLCKSETDAGLSYLRLAAESSECFDRSSAKNEKYKTMFADRCSTSRDTQYFYIDSARLMQLMEQRAAFDTVRDTAEFKAIYSHLKAVTEEVKKTFKSERESDVKN